uniref:hypothetical protein n=1 Tax=Alistipes sp. D31t1_170403_E11 TaxID=2787128 RepID=UPI001E4EE231|nr:hypothetical protein [Alistipes sp. D31t1_170403_E11]
MQEEKIANYIGEAVILLTADHLGIETEMLHLAKQVWHTKRLPDAPLLGHYASAARKAQEAVLAKGLGERADRLGQVFYMTGAFPEPCEIVRYRDFLTTYVLRSTLSDCTNGGVSSRAESLELFAPHLSFAQVANYCLENGIDVNKAIKLVYRENLDYIHAEPVIDRGRHYMFGGNYLKTSDSRFENIAGIRYPVPVHDRTEE